MNEVEGVITDQKGKVIHTLFGKWHEGMYCGDPPSATCIWRASEWHVNQPCKTHPPSELLRGHYFLYLPSDTYDTMIMKYCHMICHNFSIIYCCICFTFCMQMYSGSNNYLIPC